MNSFAAALRVDRYQTPLPGGKSPCRSPAPFAKMCLQKLGQSPIYLGQEAFATVRHLPGELAGTLNSFSYYVQARNARNGPFSVVLNGSFPEKSLPLSVVNRDGRRGKTAKLGKLDIARAGECRKSRRCQ